MRLVLGRMAKPVQRMSVARRGEGWACQKRGLGMNDISSVDQARLGDVGRCDAMRSDCIAERQTAQDLLDRRMADTGRRSSRTMNSRDGNR